MEALAVPVYKITLKTQGWISFPLKKQLFLKCVYFEDVPWAPEPGLNMFSPQNDCLFFKFMCLR